MHDPAHYEKLASEGAKPVMEWKDDGVAFATDGCSYQLHMIGIIDDARWVVRTFSPRRIATLRTLTAAQIFAEDLLRETTRQLWQPALDAKECEVKDLQSKLSLFAEMVKKKDTEIAGLRGDLEVQIISAKNIRHLENNVDTQIDNRNALRAELKLRDACAMHAAAEHLQRRADENTAKLVELTNAIIADYPDGGEDERSTLSFQLSEEADAAEKFAAELRALVPADLVPREVAENGAAIGIKAGRLYERDWGGMKECIAEATPLAADYENAKAALARAEAEHAKPKEEKP